MAPAYPARELGVALVTAPRRDKAHHNRGEQHERRDEACGAEHRERGRPVCADQPAEHRQHEREPGERGERQQRPTGGFVAVHERAHACEVPRDSVSGCHVAPGTSGQHSFIGPVTQGPVL